MNSFKKNCPLFFCFLLFFTGCYTSFKHPVMDSNGKPFDTSDIYITDNCTDCHQTRQFSCGTILPESAEEDDSWQFYAYSAWWQDNFDFFPVNVVDDNESTAPRRNPGVNNNINMGPIAVPAVPFPANLNKKNPNKAAKEPENNDNRRDFEKRQQTQKDNDNSTGNTRNSNRKK